ncbi:hypothetical protein ACOSQ2_014832 [Xanthoceras sorbifolium]
MLDRLGSRRHLGSRTNPNTYSPGYWYRHCGTAWDPLLEGEGMHKSIQSILIQAEDVLLVSSGSSDLLSPWKPSVRHSGFCTRKLMVDRNRRKLGQCLFWADKVGTDP